MKSLYEYINESLLDDLDDLENASDNAIGKESIEKFLKENYKITGRYTINNGVVDVNGSVSIKNKGLIELTNGMFVFGKVKKYFYCDLCKKLKTLEGAPKEVGETFSCYNCTSLTSLKGAPKEVGGDFSCSGCTSLTSLEGAPKEVGGSFYCSYCTSLTSLEGAPDNAGGSFYCHNCGTMFTKEQVTAVSNVKSKIYT